MKKIRENIKNVYLTGGAFGMIYHVGVMKILRKYDMTNIKLYGCSAGALTCAMVLLGYTDEQLLAVYNDISYRSFYATTTRPFDYESYNFTPLCLSALNKIKTDYPDAHKILNKKLYIGVTTEQGFKWYNEFKTIEELFNILLCSFNVPGLCSYDAIIDNMKCIDGGFGCDIDKHLPTKTLIVCPKIILNKNQPVLNGEIPVKYCIRPQPPNEIKHYYNKGANDMRNYIKYGTVSNQSNCIVSDESLVPISLWWFLRNLQS
jgi:hypothetical protein